MTVLNPTLARERRSCFYEDFYCHTSVVGSKFMVTNHETLHLLIIFSDWL